MSKELILTLLNTIGIGKGTVKKVLDFKNLPTRTIEMVEFLEELKITNSRIKVPTLNQIEKGQEIANEVIYNSEKLGIKILSPFDHDFPERYKNIPNGPVLIHVLGNTRCLNELNSVAIIGTRDPSDYGISIGRRYSKLFAENGINVISGLAKGCDTTAHEGCIEGGGKTIAILAGGLEKIYPKENHLLADRIIEAQGALISEYQIGTASLPNYFVERDRLQSGLSKALVVVETDIKGGSMHTVKFAKEQSVPVYFDYTNNETRLNVPKFQGNISMIENNKALPIRNKEDLNALINNILSNTVKKKIDISKNEEGQLTIEFD
jgi:DNA processing protein